MDIQYLSHRKKELASFVRNGDFSHPGEIEAIQKVLQYIEKKDTNTLLDVGCGLGGTASYIKKCGYGNPVCIDIDQNNINYALNKYSDIEFYCCDVLNAESVCKKQQFDIIYLISSFLTFEKQQESLATLSKLGNSNSTLVLFDYTATSISKLPNLSWTAKLHTPIDPQNINNMLKISGWKLTNFIDLSANFLQWYLELMKMITAQKDAIIKRFGINDYNSLFATYDFYTECYKNHILGGCIIIARKI